MILARVAEALRSHKVVALVAGVVLLAMGASALASSYGAVERVTRESTHERWAEEARYQYSVPVVRNSTHWPIGTALPMGLPAYYRTVSDSFDLNFSWQAPAATGTATADMTLRIVAQTSGGRVYWEIDHPLAQGEATAPDGALLMAARLDMDALVAEVEQVSKELPIGEGRVNWTVETTVAYAVDVAGQRDVAKSTYLFPIGIQDPRFILPMEQEAVWRQAHAETRATTTEHLAGMAGALSDLKGLALTGLGLATLGLVAWFAFGDPLRLLPGRDAAYVREHLRHSDWVTTVPGPIDVSSFPVAVVDVANLETLIETAADARTRVLHDHAHRIYYAVLPNATYRYARHARGT